MEGLIITRWRKPRAGKEKDAWSLGEQAEALSKRLMEQGTITGFEWIGGFTGADGHMAIVRGEPSALTALSMSPEWVEIMTRGQMVHEDWRFDFAVSGASMDEIWAGWKHLIGA